MIVHKKLIKKLLFVFLINFIFDVYAVQNTLENTNYTVNCNLWDFSWGSLKENVFYPLISPDENINDYKNQKIEFNISDKKNELSFDLTAIVFEDVYYTLEYDSVCFWSESNCIYMLYKRSDACVFLIKYDFEKLTVSNQKLGFVSYIIESLHQYWYDDFEISKSFILSYFEKNKLQLNAQKPFYFKETVNCDYNHYSNFGFYSEIKVEPEKTYIKILNDNKSYLQSIPKTAKTGTYSTVEHLIIDNVQYHTKSFLKEGAIKYEAQNMACFSNLAWCPTLLYNQEEIVIQSNKERIEGLYFGNGYYNETKNYLYKQNCRVKEIEIEFLENGMKETVCLEDSGYLQFVPLINVNSKNIKIKILSVYAGEKYNDVCINCILPVRRYLRSDYEFDSELGR